jgi:DNA-3-methyladenine glycosylase II
MNETESDLLLENNRMTAAAIADPTAREFLRNADPVPARVIDAHPDFHPRAWIDELPGLDASGTLIFQVTGQQLSVRATRTILSSVEQSFGGHLPSPAEVLAADPQVLRASGLSTRKGATIRGLAERFVDGRLSDEAFARMTDDEIEAALTEVSGMAGRWRPYRSLAVSYLFASEFEEGT